MASVTLQASTTETTDGSATAVDLQEDGALQPQLARLAITVTAASGTGQSLSVSVETGPTSSGPWRDLGKVSVDAVGKTSRLFAPLDRYLRCRWVIKGATPSFTFSVDGTTARLYASVEDFERLGLPAAAIADVEQQTLLTALLSASSKVDAHIPKRYLLPLSPPYPEVLTEQACKMAAWTVLRVRGFDPDSPADRIIADGDTEATDWLKMVAKGTIEPPWVDATPTVQEGAAVVISSPARGW